MLTLTIKRKWFGMIASGEKKEEYRDLTPYYKSRFTNLWNDSEKSESQERIIRLRNGYSKRSPSILVKCTLKIGTGNPDWGAELRKRYYILEIHEVMLER